jgi:hypothetical protein
MNAGREQDQQERKKPTLIAYSVKLNDGDATWTRIGAPGRTRRGRFFDPARCVAVGGLSNTWT